MPPQTPHPNHKHTTTNKPPQTHHHSIVPRVPVIVGFCVTCFKIYYRVTLLRKQDQNCIVFEEFLKHVLQHETIAGAIKWHELWIWHWPLSNGDSELSWPGLGELRWLPVPRSTSALESYRAVHRLSVDPSQCRSCSCYRKSEEIRKCYTKQTHTAFVIIFL